MSSTLSLPRFPTLLKEHPDAVAAAVCGLLVANFAIHITLPLGVIGHEGSTVLVTLSGLRLLKV